LEQTVGHGTLYTDRCSYLSYYMSQAILGLPLSRRY
jgi:hypothetical protein